MVQWNVRAEYDTQAGVWYIVESDMPGLWCDADTLDGLETKIASMIEDLLEIHADDLEVSRRSPPHEVRVVAHHERSFGLAA